MEGGGGALKKPGKMEEDIKDSDADEEDDSEVGSGSEEDEDEVDDEDGGDLDTKNCLN